MILPLPIIHTILERTNNIDIRCSFGIYRKLSGSYEILNTVCTKHSSISSSYRYTRWYYFIRRKNMSDGYEYPPRDAKHIPRHILQEWQYMWSDEFLLDPPRKFSFELLNETSLIQ